MSLFVITEKEMKMAQIITLQELQNRASILRRSHIETKDKSASPLGPAQVLFFTGVRYERYGDESLEAAKLARKSRRKKSAAH
jgi:hypothetical protein